MSEELNPAETLARLDVDPTVDLSDSELESRKSIEEPIN